MVNNPFINIIYQDESRLEYVCMSVLCIFCYQVEMDSIGDNLVLWVWRYVLYKLTLIDRGISIWIPRLDMFPFLSLNCQCQCSFCWPRLYSHSAIQPSAIYRLCPFVHLFSSLSFFFASPFNSFA